MIIKTMWGLRRNESTPELMEAWDELCVEENPEGFTEACEKRRQEWGSDVKNVRFIDLEVSTRTVHETFATKTIMAKAVDAAKAEK